MLSKEYLSDKRMSQSKLKVILDGVEEFKYKLDNPTKPTDSQNLGSAVHVLILEPHRCDVIQKVPKFDSKTREGKIFNFLMEGKGPAYFPFTAKKKKNQEKDLFYEVDEEEHDFVLKMGAHYGHIFTNPHNYLILDDTEYEQAHRMAQAAFKNEDTAYILKCSQHFEKTHYFNYMGIDFKCQLDSEGYMFIGDLKTTIVKNNDFDIKREIRKYRYHFQAATYAKRFGNKRFILEGPYANFKYYILFVRSVAPYAVFPVQLSQELFDEGCDQLDEGCTIYNDCLINNPNFIANNKLRVI